MSDYAELVKGLRDCSRRNARVCMICGAKASNLCEGTKSKRMFYAAGAIEELLEEKAKLENSGKLLVAAFDRLKEKVPQWISVEERLPEGNGTRYEYDLEESNLVLVYGINHIGEMAYGLGSYIYDHADPKDSGWNGYMDCDYDLDYCTVTHWMPLPEPPKEDAK